MLSVDIFAVRVDRWGTVEVTTDGAVCPIEVCVSFETTVREAVWKSEERGIDVARATARIILWGGICQSTLM